MSINPRTSGGNTLYPEGIVASQQVATWSQYQASSDVNLAGNTIQNVSVIEVNDISGLDSADIVPLIENATITNLSITNLTSVNSGAIADLVSFDVLVENDLSINGVLRSHQLDTLSGRVDTLSGYVDGLTSGATTLADAIALDNDASDLSIVNLGNVYIGKTDGSNNALEVEGVGIFSSRVGIGATTSPPGSEFLTLQRGTNGSLAMNIRNTLVSYGGFVVCKDTTGDFALEQLDAKEIRFITTPSTPGNRADRLVIQANGTIRIPAYTTNGTLTTTSSNGTLVVSSDRRAKTDIVPATDLHGLDIVNKLKPTYYRYLHERETDHHLGFIAQEVEEAGLGVAVDGKKYEYDFIYDIIEGDSVSATPTKTIKLNPDGTPMLDYTKPRYRGLDHAGLIATLVKAVQELNIKVDKLTKLVI
jgi:hypothetical protein